MSTRARILGEIRRLGLMRLVNPAANVWFSIVKLVARIRGKSDVDAVYTARYHEAETDMTLPSGESVVECLMSEFLPRSVVDVGCGTGVYLREFGKHGLDIRGYEGSSAAIGSSLVETGTILLHDLRRALRADRRFDLVISFEVGEHLPPTSSLQYVENIACLGPTIVFSAAQPGQGGTDHINEQPSRYWIEHFEGVGFEFKAERTQRVREAPANTERCMVAAIEHPGVRES